MLFAHSISLIKRFTIQRICDKGDEDGGGDRIGRLFGNWSKFTDNSFWISPRLAKNIIYKMQSLAHFFSRKLQKKIETRLSKYNCFIETLKTGMKNRMHERCRINTMFAFLIGSMILKLYSKEINSWPISQTRKLRSKQMLAIVNTWNNKKIKLSSFSLFVFLLIAIILKVNYGFHL